MNLDLDNVKTRALEFLRRRLGCRGERKRSAAYIWWAATRQKREECMPAPIWEIPLARRVGRVMIGNYSE